MPSLHDRQDTIWIERLALKPAGAQQPDSEVQFSLLYPPEKSASPVLDQLHLNSGVHRSVPRQHFWQSCLDELRRCPDTEHSRFPPNQSSRTLPQGIGVRQEPSGPLQEFVPIPCEHDTASEPVEQPAREVTFEILNLSR